MNHSNTAVGIVRLRQNTLRAMYRRQRATVGTLVACNAVSRFVVSLILYTWVGAAGVTSDGLHIYIILEWRRTVRVVVAVVATRHVHDLVGHADVLRVRP